MRPCFSSARSLCSGSHSGIFGRETRTAGADEADRVGDHAPKAQTTGGHGQDEDHQEFQQIRGTVRPKHISTSTVIAYFNSATSNDYHSLSIFRFEALEREEPKKTKKRRKQSKGTPQLNNNDDTDYEALFAKAFYQ